MENKIAELLLKIEAVFLSPQEPFTWASGIKSPIYCDIRLTLSYPEVRDIIQRELANLIREKYPECEAVFGTSTAGIPHAAFTSSILNLPMGYVRGSAKDHGMTNRIEGKLEKGQKVVVIEDLISTAGSVVEVVEALREAGAEVLGIASIFTYGLDAGIERLKEANVANFSLSNYDALIQTAVKTGYISEKDIKRLKKFKDNPKDPSWMDV